MYHLAVLTSICFSCPPWLQKSIQFGCDDEFPMFQPGRSAVDSCVCGVRWRRDPSQSYTREWTYVHAKTVERDREIERPRSLIIISFLTSPTRSVQEKMTGHNAVACNWGFARENSKRSFSLFPSPFYQSLAHNVSRSVQRRHKWRASYARAGAWDQTHRRHIISHKNRTAIALILYWMLP